MRSFCGRIVNLLHTLSIRIDSLLTFPFSIVCLECFSFSLVLCSGGHCLNSQSPKCRIWVLITCLWVEEFVCVCVCEGVTWFLAFVSIFGVLWCISLHVGSVEDTFKLAADQVYTLSLRSEGSFIVKSQSKTKQLNHAGVKIIQFSFGPQMPHQPTWFYTNQRRSL